MSVTGEAAATCRRPGRGRRRTARLGVRRGPARGHPDLPRRSLRRDLGWRGITHLVEHLALYREGLAAAPHFNGQVDDISTTFYLSDEPEDVTGFLTRVSDQPRPPAHRTPGHRTRDPALRGRRTIPGGGYLSLLRWRYGPRTYGLAPTRSSGCTGSGPRTSRVGQPGCSRARTRCSCSAGRRRPVFSSTSARVSGSGPSPPSSALPQLPAWYHEGDPGAASLATVPRSTAANALRHVVEQRLASRLRYDLGASYSPAVAYEPRDATDAHLFVGVDAVPEHADAVRREVDQVLQELGEDDVVAADLATWGRDGGQALVEPGAGAAGCTPRQSTCCWVGRLRLRQLVRRDPRARRRRTS